MAPEPATVHLVAKTHLDLGFTDLAAAVADCYVTDFFPRAVAVARELRAAGAAERLVWTTGSWILHHALTAGDAATRELVAEAIEAGDLTWHALPVTTHTELTDADLFRSGLAIGGELDERFGRRTTAAKMTDVPGHTRAMVPLLAEAEVTFLHLGVNPAWPLPDVPPVFRWRSSEGAEIIVAYQAGGYGGEVMVPGCPDVLAFLHTGDNLGPPTAEEVVAAHAELAARHPGATVRASTLDAFARAVVASGAVEALPVVTAEIGDPWLFGAASDPQKVAAYRELLRRRRHLPANGASSGRARVDRQLLLVAEHTWGLDQKEWLSDDTRWDRAGLAAIRATPEGARFESAWAEQRAYVAAAADRLDDAWSSTDPVGQAGSQARPARRIGGAVAAAAEVDAPPLGPDDEPDSAYLPLGRDAVVDGGAWHLGLDPSTGAIAHLVEAATGRVVAGDGHRLGLVTYQSFDEADYERFYAGLSSGPEDEWWARWDNTKPGIDAAGAISGVWEPEVTGAWHARAHDGDRHEVLVRAAFGGVAVDRLGAPAELWTRWCWWATGGPGRGGAELEGTVWWADKAANRLPEALWCSFVPVVAEPHRWTLDKLGQAVSPLDVVRRGGRSLHAVGEGMAYDGPDGPLRIATPDAPLVAPGRPNLLDADPPLPELAGGFHVLLADNCWGTNFAMWIEGPARFRFTIATMPPPT
jgi:hypothetical protein